MYMKDGGIHTAIEAPAGASSRPMPRARLRVDEHCLVLSRERGSFRVPLRVTISDTIRVIL